MEVQRARFSTSSALLVENTTVPSELRAANYRVARKNGTNLGAHILRYHPIDTPEFKMCKNETTRAAALKIQNRTGI